MAGLMGAFAGMHLFGWLWSYEEAGFAGIALGALSGLLLGAIGMAWLLLRERPDPDSASALNPDATSSARAQLSPWMLVGRLLVSGLAALVTGLVGFRGAIEIVRLNDYLALLDLPMIILGTVGGLLGGLFAAWRLTELSWW